MEQSMGALVSNWTRRPHPLDNPQYYTLQGQYCRLELLNSKTNDTVLQQLYDAFKPTEETHFQYLKYGPFQTVDELKELVKTKEKPENDTVLYSILVNEKAVGFCSYLRISPEQGTIEIGNLNFSQELIRTRQATEVVFLMLQLAFDTFGYRRVEWRCNALNTKSRIAAVRFGFQYEGTWLKATVCKGRSRDDAWHSIVDDEWPYVKQEFQRWLRSDNFDKNEQQLTKLNGSLVNPRRSKTDDVN